MAKGIGFAHVRAFVEERFGKSGWERLTEQLDAEDRSSLRSVAATGWYSLALYSRLINALEAGFGTGDFTLIREQGRFQAERDLKVVFRLLFRLANPGYVVSKMIDFWNRLQSAGTWKVEREGPHLVRGTLNDWAVDRALCAELLAYMERVIELVGGKEVVGAHPACRAHGDPACVYTMRWR